MMTRLRHLFGRLHVYQLLRLLHVFRATRPGGVATRPLVEADLEPIARHFEEPGARATLDDLARQREGESSAIVAWMDGAPVGIGFIRWRRPRHPELADAWRGTPEIYRLFVNDSHRSEGIGTHILAALEDAARRAGHVEVGLGVHTNNPRARELYVRHGYIDTGALFHDEYDVVDEHGVSRRVLQPAIFFVRLLTPPTPPTPPTPR